MNTPSSLDADQAHARLGELTVVDVRTPAEYAGGHLPGALNVPLDRLDRAVPDLEEAAARGSLLVVCQSGGRSAAACGRLAARGVAAIDLAGGTSGWAARGYALERPAGAPARVPWAMDRQVRLVAGSLVLLGLLLGVFVHPALQLLAAAVAGGLVFSALTNTCAMAVLLGKLPYNQAGAGAGVGARDGAAPVRDGRQEA
ncbi:rhodanese-like domain-containing protein [Streptomyces sp. NPDC012769]|uniref:rhodanese-like domain-containing protein n=1 Tax=Streptomyces sp. NPDC012769 TaxID=3364848 RepID=UPI00369D600D